MHGLLRYLVLSFSLVTASYSHATSQSQKLAVRRTTTPLPLPVNVVYEFPKDTWLENLVVRSDSGGDIITTLLESTALYLINPSTEEATLLHTFPLTAATGITQLGHDIFYVAAGNFSLNPPQLIPGSFSIFKVDIRGYDKHGVDGVTVTELVNLADSVLLNGMARLNSASKTLLIADSINGYVWEVDADTGAFTNISLPEMLPPPGSALNLGINGVKTKDGHLYWSNQGYGTLNRVAVDQISGAVIGSVEVLATDIVPDDFVLGDNGYIWICQNALNTLSVLLPNGTVVNVAGSQDSLVVPGPSACEFGWDQKLYCTTTGGQLSPVNGTIIGGELIEFDTKDFYL